MDQKKPQIASPSVNETRRRLTQGGLAAPVVLATLSSSNALAGSTPYKCTISGKLSNNTSNPGTKSCSSLGKSCDGWKTSSWTSLKKGTCTKLSGQNLHTDPNNNTMPAYMGACMKDVVWSGKQFNPFYCRQKSKKTGVWSPVSAGTSGCTHMTLHEVLYLDDTSGAANPGLGRETVAAFLNAVECAPNFPLKPDEVIAMFNATCSGGTYQVKTGVYWNATQVCNYFSCLHT